MSAHSIDDVIEVNGIDPVIFDRAHQAAVMAGVTGSIGSTDRRSYRAADGTLTEDPDVRVEAIKQITSALNRKFGVWSWGPAYRVEGTGTVIVRAGGEGRYKSHAA